MEEFYLIVSAAVYAPEKMGKPQLCHDFGVGPDQPIELIDVYPKEPAL